MKVFLLAHGHNEMHLFSNLSNCISADGAIWIGEKKDWSLLGVDNLIHINTKDSLSAGKALAKHFEGEKVVVVGLEDLFSGEVLSSFSSNSLQGLVWGCHGFSREGDFASLEKYGFGGKVLYSSKLSSGSVQFNSKFLNSENSNPKDPSVVSLECENNHSFEFVEFDSIPSKDKDISSSEVIISGGRGIQGPEGFESLKTLAKKLDAAIGASRAVVDMGWIDYSHQVGQTGKSVTPKLYIAFGISGAVQHRAGMQNSSVIVAINTDRNAPIFDICDYGIVADWKEVLEKWVSS